MPTCSRCQRRVWLWEANLFGGACARCRAEKAIAREDAASKREAARRSAFEQAGALRRAWVGARRGALLGTCGLVVVAASLLALVGGPGSRYPFQELSVGWILVSLGAVLAAAFVGWWLSSWLIVLAALIGVGAVGGAIVGGYRGLCGRCEVFAAAGAARDRGVAR